MTTSDHRLRKSMYAKRHSMICTSKNMKMSRKGLQFSHGFEWDSSSRILYADIVNFTPLSEKFTPPELVQILNKLFGKFDQLAQVRSRRTEAGWLEVARLSRSVIVCESKSWAIATIVSVAYQSVDQTMPRTVYAWVWGWSKISSNRSALVAHWVDSYVLLRR